MSEWAKGPEHGWKAIHRIRQDANADIVEEFYARRSFYVGAVLFVAACVAGWWWQATLDGWARGAVLTLTIILTLYLIVMGGWLLFIRRLGQFIRSV